MTTMYPDLTQRNSPTKNCFDNLKLAQMLRISDIRKIYVNNYLQYIHLDISRTMNGYCLCGTNLTAMKTALISNYHRLDHEGRYNIPPEIMSIVASFLVVKNNPIELA